MNGLVSNSSWIDLTRKGRPFEITLSSGEEPQDSPTPSCSKRRSSQKQLDTSGTGSESSKGAAQGTDSALMPCHTPRSKPGPISQGKKPKPGKSKP